ncbi:helix-turn-helix domain-containing protein [Komagataeibacter sp. FNDCF1]|nr:helix-turn-helix domain-containing protein [Komagataeibacter sp. FNDCF1]MCE2564133.1 helix-turn-helix domain-containing protein [Komagataeibacter sp. FNDCF1]
MADSRTDVLRRGRGGEATRLPAGRRPSIDRDQIHTMNEEGISPTEIARRLGIGRTSVYRCLALQLHFMARVRADGTGLMCSSKDGPSENVSDG